MINNKILELEYEVSNAVEFMRKCPLTLGGLKNLLSTNKDKLEYEEYLSESEFKDGEDSFFSYLNDCCGVCDEEVIEKILEDEVDEYFIDFRTDSNQYDTYWKIYKINKESLK